MRAVLSADVNNWGKLLQCCQLNNLSVRCVCVCVLDGVLSKERKYLAPYWIFMQ